MILDFFFGSGGIGQAVYELNQEEGTDRVYWGVQIPERINPKDKDSKHALEFCKINKKPPTIAEISKERIRRAGTKIKQENPDYSNDLGFKVFKLDKSNFKIWDGNIEDKPIHEQLELVIDHIDPNSKEEDILYEILLKSGFELTTPIQTLSLEGKKVYSVAEGALLICLEKNLTTELIRAIAKMEPQRVVCLDSGFEGMTS